MKIFFIKKKEEVTSLSKCLEELENGTYYHMIMCIKPILPLTDGLYLC